MLRFLRGFALALLAVLGLLGFHKLGADEPIDPEMMQAVNEAVQQTLEQDPSELPSGDAIRIGAHAMISEVGSILGESCLDPGNNPLGGGKSGATTRRAIAAEQLLKASRLLEAQGDPELERASLIQRMRGEAAKLLME